MNRARQPISFVSCRSMLKLLVATIMDLFEKYKFRFIPSVANKHDITPLGRYIPKHFMDHHHTPCGTAAPPSVQDKGARRAKGQGHATGLYTAHLS